MELAASEAERARLVSAARTAELASRALRAQLAEAGVAFRAAMGPAQGFLQQGRAPVCSRLQRARSVCRHAWVGCLESSCEGSRSNRSQSLGHQ
jgi:cob(I)alamin adenosyltransferase